MKTSIEISEELVNEIMALTGLKTKKAVVDMALRFYMKAQRSSQLARELKGSFKTIISNEELEKLRES